MTYKEQHTIWTGIQGIIEPYSICVTTIRGNSLERTGIHQYTLVLLSLLRDHFAYLMPIQD